MKGKTKINMIPIYLGCVILFRSVQPVRTLPWQLDSENRVGNMTYPDITLKTPGTSETPSQQMKVSKEYDSILIDSLKEIFEGPLVGRMVTILLDGSIEKYISPDYLLASMEIPVSILRLSEHCQTSIAYRGDERLALENDTRNTIESTDMENEMVYCQSENPIFMDMENAVDQKITADVLVHITGEEEHTVLRNTPSSWSLSGLLLISLRENCDIDSLFGAPQASNTACVVLMCPVLLKINLEGFQMEFFRVYSWRPFHPDKKQMALGIWSVSSFPKWKDLFVDRFSSFYGSTLHASSDRSDVPFLFINPDGAFDGISKRIMDALAKWLNFNFTLTERAGDERWGAKVNGTWVGMLGEVWSEKKDLTINSFTITEERTKDFGFSTEYYRAGFGFHIREPPPLPRYLNLLYPFTWNVWAGTAASVIIMAIVFCFLQFDQPRLSIYDSFIFIIKSIINQNIDKIPESWLLRVFLSIWWFSAFVIVVSYTSNLIAILSIPTYPMKLQSVQQLADSNYRLCMLDYGDFVPKALAKSSDPKLFALGAKLDLVPMTEQEWDGDEACVDHVLGGHYAHLDFFPYLQNLYISLGHIDAIYNIKEKIYEANLAFFFRKNTPWIYKFNQGIRRLIEANLIDKWQDDIMTARKGIGAKRNQEATDKPLTLSHLLGPFLILAMGYGCACITFIVEFLRYHCKL